MTGVQTCALPICFPVTIGIGGWEINLKTNVLTWTKQVYKIHEVEEDFIPVVEKVIKFYEENSIPIIQKAVNDAVKYGIPFNLELKIISAKGNIKDVRAIGYVEKDENNLSEYIYGTFQDITKQKKIEKELIDAKEKTDEDKERFKFVLEGSNSGYRDWETDRKSVV